ncbi:DUF2971 domain-containing protein [Photobacterium phosphoreum]|uniref:DUF2971 domain-containing protein n=1 Tax=Photobacterium phosphoreum TaxID=659 RepID=UPI000D15A4B9|nr:DUF2971 domain-containing protein [Photobacterium phosphoreum]PSU75033.1 DUF2971 domain-containing protein [Photobacterium phosphoreum]PSW27407.1 DUF2971 domain-containing protein [Photobacterium phosphoreum]
MKVYKYLSFSEGSLAVLKDQTLKFSCYDEFNDPFDCIAEYDIEASLEYFRTEIYSSKLIGDAEPSSAKKNIVDAKIRRFIESGQLHLEVVKQVGILCLSHKDDSILMWSHYANNHTGFVVEFDIDLLTAKYGAKSVDWTLIGYDVDYVDLMPILKAAKGDFDSVRRMFLCKSKDWEYESEYRVLTMNKGAGIHRFNGELISRVIAGVKISDDNFILLQSLVSKIAKKYDKEIQLDKASMVQGAYKLKTSNKGLS